MLKKSFFAMCIATLVLFVGALITLPFAASSGISFVNDIMGYYKDNEVVLEVPAVVGQKICFNTGDMSTYTRIKKTNTDKITLYSNGLKIVEVTPKVTKSTDELRIDMDYRVYDKFQNVVNLVKNGHLMEFYLEVPLNTEVVVEGNRNSYHIEDKQSTASTAEYHREIDMNLPNGYESIYNTALNSYVDGNINRDEFKAKLDSTGYDVMFAFRRDVKNNITSTEYNQDELVGKAQAYIDALSGYILVGADIMIMTPTDTTDTAKTESMKSPQMQELRKAKLDAYQILFEARKELDSLALDNDVYYDVLESAYGILGIVM